LTTPADAAAVFRRGLEAYAAGQHYEAHEFWEELWNVEQDDARSRFLQALIQIASAAHKIRHDVAPRGSLFLLARACGRLEGLGDVFMGVDVAALVRASEATRAALAAALSTTGSLDAIPIPRIDVQTVTSSWPMSAPPSRRSEGAWVLQLEKGLAAYRAGEFFEAHEEWEEIWRDEPEGDRRQALQGLIQVAAAMYKILGQGKPVPAARLLGRALLRLKLAPPGFASLQMLDLLGDVERAREALVDIGEKGDGDFSHALVPRMIRTVS